MAPADVLDRILERQRELWNDRLFTSPDARWSDVERLTARKEATAAIGEDFTAIGRSGTPVTTAFYEYAANLGGAIIRAILDEGDVDPMEVRPFSDQAGEMAVQAVTSRRVERILGSTKPFIDEVIVHGRYLYEADLARELRIELPEDCRLFGELLRQAYRAGGIPVGLTAGLPGGRLRMYWRHGSPAGR